MNTIIDARAQLCKTNSTNEDPAFFLHNLPTYIRDAAEYNVSHAILTQPSILQDDNQHLLNAIQTSPNKIKGIALVQPSISYPDLVKLKNNGICGVRFPINMNDSESLLDGKWQPLIEKIAKLDLIISLNQSAETGLIESIKYLSRFSIKMIIERMGYPDVFEGIHGLNFQSTLAACLNNPRIWFDLSGCYRSKLSYSANHKINKSFTVALLKAMGSKRLLWGSDWPFNGYEDQVGYRLSLNWLTKYMRLDSSTLRDLTYNNAAELFGFNT